MNNTLIIDSFCKISERKVVLNDELLYHDEESSNYNDFIKSAYRKLNIGYAKFFKMDGLSRLGFLTAELLINSQKITQSYQPEEIGIQIFNAASSLDTDLTYQVTIKDPANYFPSPAVFVYTLPNIMIGEICIKHKITGESSFYIREDFNAEALYQMVNSLFEINKVKCCIAGWVELLGENYESVLYVIKKAEDSTSPITENVIFEPGNIQKIFSH